jgi:hypothetical protein
MGNFLSNYVTDFIGRFDGPLHFRSFVQPLMAILFAALDGLHRPTSTVSGQKESRK